jgi:prepilin-type N-terminal cleavage/methylation domain-containing protein
MSLFLNRSNLSTPPHPPLTKGEQRGGAGFTLIEVFIAVAILSIVLTAIYSTFFLSYRAIDGMDESMLKLQESRMAIDILRRELDSTFYRGNEADTVLKIQDRDINGKQASQLTFTTFSPLRPGLSRISYYIENRDGKLNLFKKLELPYAKEETEGVDIIEDLEAFTVEVLYNDRWVKTWDTNVTKGLPGEIRIGLSIMIKGDKMTIFDVSRPRVDRSV